MQGRTDANAYIIFYHLRVDVSVQREWAHDFLYTGELTTPSRLIFFFFGTHDFGIDTNRHWLAVLSFSCNDIHEDGNDSRWTLKNNSSTPHSSQFQRGEG